MRGQFGFLRNYAVSTGTRGWLRRSRFRLLAVSMMTFGTLVGLIFPPVSIWALGLPWSELKLNFFALSLGAGLAVGLVNYELFVLVVSGTFSELARKMLHVQHQLSGDKTCDFTECQVAIGSEDAMGDAAQAFNGLVESLAHSRKQNQFLNEFVLTLTRSLEREEIWDVGLQGLLENTGCQGAALLLSDEGRLRIVRSCGFDPESLPQNGFSAEQGLLAEVAAAHAPLTINVTSDLPLNFNALAVSLRPARVSLFPLALRKGNGVLVLAWTSLEPMALNEDTIAAASRSLAVVIDSTLLFRKFKEMAAFDELTGMYNRRFGWRRLKEEIARAQREGTSLSVAMIDLDHFKRVNDTFGHLAGDLVLRQLSVLLQKGLRVNDVMVRYGGEEVLLILTGANKDNAMRIVERSRAAFEYSAVMWEEREVKVTFSAGIAECGEDPAVTDDAESLAGRADRRLYSAKAKGRNRIEVE